MSHAPDQRLADIWSEHRRYLVDIAFRMVGSVTEAEDAVQEAFMRLLNVDIDEIDDLRGWLVVVTGRICLDHMGSARVRHSTGMDIPAEVATDAPDPADAVTLDDSIRMALTVVLERLTPPERAAFVLHDVFQFSFDDVASIVGRSPAACRQLASRARRHIEDETGPARFEVEPAEEREVVERFVAACQGGDLEALLDVLDPDVVGEADVGVPEPVAGRENVGPRVLMFLGPQAGATVVSIAVNGEPGILVRRRSGELGALVVLSVRNGRVHHIRTVADPRQLAYLSPLK
jgi:RNA polymerase sigma-70 factor (ECF subfamily)